MKIVALSILLAITSSCFAQQDTTLVYNSSMYVKDPVRSQWRPVVKRNGELFAVTFYDKKDAMQEVVNFEDRNLEVRKGPYTRYSNSILVENGNYDKGHKHGIWEHFKIDGQKVAMENFVYGKLNGKSIKYWGNQQVQEEGSYNADKKIGSWFLYYDNGKIAGEEMYDSEGKKIDGKYFTKMGSAVDYEDLFSRPTYKGGINEFYKYLASNIQFPPAAIKSGATGTVKLSFTVNKDGVVEDIIVVQSPDYDLEREAIRVLSKSKWIPGKMFGEVVKVKYTLPIKFSPPKNKY